jgi:peroxiredoxin
MSQQPNVLPSIILNAGRSFSPNCSHNCSAQKRHTSSWLQTRKSSESSCLSSISIMDVSIMHAWGCEEGDSKIFHSDDRMQTFTSIKTN